MSAIVCPFCGMQCTDAATRERVPGGDSSFVCRGCGKAVEPPLAGKSVPAPPLQNPGGASDRWSDGPPEASANRWSAQPPLGDDSSSSESVSQTSILPRGESDQAVPVRPTTAPLVWALILLALFLAALIGVIVLARAIRPWLAARRTTAQQATVEFWLPRLEKGSDEAAQAIVNLGPEAVCHALELIAKDPSDGKPAARAVGALANTGTDAVPGLCKGLGSPEPRVRAMAIEVLQQMGAAGRDACDSLLATLDDENRTVRSAAMDTLGYLGADGGPAAKRLAELVASADGSTRQHAIKALGRIGPKAGDAVEALKKAAADDPNVENRSSASLALKQIDVADLAHEIRRNTTGELRKRLIALEDDDTPAAVAAAEALGKLGFEGQSAAPGLALMLHHADRQRRLAAAKALGRLGVAAADYVPTLEAAAKEEDAEVRAAAAKALEPPGGKP